jgi:hypothetical protein
MAVKKEKTHPHPDKLKLYEKLIAAFPEIEMKGDSMRYTSLNGNMYSFLAKEGMAGIRLPEKERDEFLKKYKTKLFEAYGAVLKEYVTVPAKLLENTKELAKYFSISYAYAKSLKPKLTVKKEK